MIGTEEAPSTPRDKEWQRSLHRDAGAATDLAKRSSAMHTQWGTILDALEQCSGQIFTSGIGGLHAV